MKGIIYTVILAIILAIMIGCKTKTVYVPVESKEKGIEYIDRWHRDSIYIQDSIFYAIKGDTIYKEKYKTLYKEIVRIDSITKDSIVYKEIPYPVVEIKEVNRLKNWQIFLMALGGILIGFLIYRVVRLVK